MRALARKASKLAIYSAAGLCAQKSGASDKILKLCRRSSFAAKLGARAVVRSFSRTDKFTDELTKKHASADGENSKANAASRRKRTASVSSASIKKDASLSKSASAKKNTATKSAPAKRSPLAKKPASVAKPASTAKSIAPAAASVSIAKSASVKNAVQNKISAASVKSAAAKSTSQNAKSRRIAKNTATPAVVIAAKDAAASGVSSVSTAKQPRPAAKSAPLKSSAAGKS